MNPAEATVGIIGLGYVGLPLAVEFGRQLRTVGFDLSAEKLAAYRRHDDPTGEVGRDEFRASTHLKITGNPSDLSAADFVIVAVPTPVDDANLPDFGPILSACRSLGPHLKQGATVIFESTVYPGATEDVCVPALELASGKQWKKDFFVGYSPERINPGDKAHTLAKIVKVVSGDTPETLDENTQRDLNIALMNELSSALSPSSPRNSGPMDASWT